TEGEEGGYFLMQSQGGFFADKAMSVDSRLRENESLLDMCLGINQCIYLFGETGTVYILSDSGKLLSEYEAYTGKLYLKSCRAGGDGIVFAASEYRQGGEQVSLYYIDAENTGAEKLGALDGEAYAANVLADGASGGYYCIGTDYLLEFPGISGVDGSGSDSKAPLKEEEMLPVIGWSQANIAAGDIRGACAIEGEKWLILLQDSETPFVLLKKGVEENRIKLTLACVEENSDILRQTADFNNKNENYYIELISYGDREDPYQAFMVDLTAADDWDIVVLPPQKENLLIQKGLLEDLYPYIDRDAQLDRKDFLENILAAYEWPDGGLYETVSGVSVSGWLTKRSNIEMYETWNMESFKDLVEQYPEAELFSRTSGNDILTYFLEEAMDTVIDWEAGTCSFETEQFYEMLKLARQYGGEQDISVEDEIRAVVENRLLFSRIENTSPTFIALYESALDGDVTVLGSPFLNDGSRGVHSEDSQYGIMKSSKNRDGAWEFVRYFFTEDYQKLDAVTLNLCAIYAIPTRSDCLAQIMKRVTATEAYELEGILVEPLEGMMNTSLYDCELKPLNKAQEQMYRELITGSLHRAPDRSIINDIILEECRAYFLGDKDEKETAHLIQNRVQLYISENR
ncbi:MAG: extracellular solute-binding protein, partial [Lachnospiraceae bacterium]|nr:extracellular solute-binding protein [Lachnospiraceae bacterium]